MIIRGAAFAGFTFVMYDGNGLPKAGLTVTATRSLDGAAFAACANSPAEVAGGAYAIDLAAADVDADSVTFRFAAPGADTTLVTVFPAGAEFDLNFKSTAELAGVNVNTAVNIDSLTFKAAGAVMYFPFRVHRWLHAKRMLVKNGVTVSGNTTMGIIDGRRGSVGDLLAITPATAQSGSEEDQIIALTSAVELPAGRYFKALSNSGILGSYKGWTASVSSSESGTTGKGLNAIGIRASAAGGIVASPTVVDVSIDTWSDPRGQIPRMAVLGFDDDELVAA